MVAFHNRRADSAFRGGLAFKLHQHQKLPGALYFRKKSVIQDTHCLCYFLQSVCRFKQTQVRALKCAGRAWSAANGARKKSLETLSGGCENFSPSGKTLIPSLLRGSLPSEHKWALPRWDIPEHSYIPTGCNSWLLSELSLASDNIGGRDKTAPWRTELWQAPDRCMPIVSAPAFRFRLVWGAWGIRYLLLKDARSDFLHCLNTICRRYSV